MSTEKYYPSHIANFFLKKAKEDNKQITQMKLQKLVYIGYGWILAVLDQELFDEDVCAWQHGPVIRSLYNEFKHFGNRPIDTLAVEYDLDRESMYYPEIEDKESDEPIKVVLEKVWDIYKDISAWTLRNKTHENGTPWSKVYTGGTNDILNKADIKTHFEDKIREYLSA